MDERTFVPALLELQHSSADTVVSYFHKLFSEISRMGPKQVTAAFQTVKCIAESNGLEHDVAVRHVLSSLHQRMVALVNGSDDILTSNKLANTFCTLLRVEVKYRHMAEQYLAQHSV